MKVLSEERSKWIKALSSESPQEFPVGLLEKDEHLSDALAALFALQLDDITLVFCGGSSLSKSHGVIERMSEDADVKVVLSPALLKLSGNQLRSRLSKLKAAVTEALAATGLELELGSSTARNQNHYFRSEWLYQPVFAPAIGLRPHLQVEFTVRTPMLPTVDLPIARLADQMAGKKTDSPSVPTISLAETVAEKVLSFLRRFAQHRAGEMRQDWDTTLVRHIYDVHCIFQRYPEVVSDAATAFPQLVEGDRQEFGSQSPDFAESPKRVLSEALAKIAGDVQSQDEYARQLLPLVYGGGHPSYAEAFASFERGAKVLIGGL